MQFTYTISRQDSFAFLKHFLDISDTIKKKRKIFRKIAAIILSMLLIQLFFRTGMGSVKVAGDLIACGLFCNGLGLALVALPIFMVDLALPFLIRRSSKKSLEKMLLTGNNPIGIGPQVFHIDPEFFYVRNRRGEHKHKWSSLLKVTSTENHLYLWQSELQAYVVPKLSGYEEEWSHFASLVQQQFTKFQSFD